MKKIYILVNVIAFIWMSEGGVVWAQQAYSMNSKKTEILMPLSLTTKVKI